MKMKSWVCVSKLVITLLFLQAASAFAWNWTFNDSSGWRLYGTYPNNFGARTIAWSGTNRVGETWIAQNATWGWSEMARYKDTTGQTCYIDTIVQSTHPSYLETVEVDRWIQLTPRVHQTTANTWQWRNSSEFSTSSGKELYIRWVQPPASSGTAVSKLAHFELFCYTIR